MMKLHIISLETREILKMEFPPQCSIHQLKQMLSGEPGSIHLSLNKADEIQSSSPNEDTLQSLGIGPGDLIFYINPNPSAVPSETIPFPDLGSGFNPRPFSTPDKNSKIDQKPLRGHTLMGSLNPKVAEPNLPCHQEHQSEGMKPDTDLREKVGFEPCFMGLPNELKQTILELSPGEDVAKISCLSRELRDLASIDDLWMQRFVKQFGDASKFQKFVEHFGDASKLYEEGPWKTKFARVFELARVFERVFERAFELARVFERRNRGSLFDPPPRRLPTFGRSPLWSGCPSARASTINASDVAGLLLEI